MSSLKDLASLIMVPSLYKDGELHTVKPLGNSILHPDATGNHDGTDGSTPAEGNFTFSRGSNLAATRVDVNGLIEKGRANYILHSQDIDNAYWNKLGMSVTANQATAPNGTTTADLIDDGTATGNHFIEENEIIGGGIATASIHAKYVDTQYLVLAVYDTAYRVVVFDIQNGTIGNQNLSTLIPTIQDLGGGWYRCAVTHPANTRNDPYIAFGLRDDDVAAFNTGAGFNRQAYVWGAQLEQGLVATDYIETGASTAQAGILEDMPRLDYSGSCPALLLEPQRQNRLPHSEYFEGWTSSGATITSNYGESPEGKNNATRIVFSGSTGYVYYPAGTGVGSQTSTMYVKGTSGETIVFGKGGNVASGSSFTLDGTWQRLEHTGTNLGSAFHISTFKDSTARDILVWGAQLEDASYPTSYIPTYGASVTRSLDVCDLNGMNASGISTSNNWTYFIDVDDFEAGSNGFYLYSTSGEILHLFSTSVGYRNTSNSTDYVASWSWSSYNGNNSRIKMIFRYDGDKLVVFLNGVKKDEIDSSLVSSRFNDPFNRDRFHWAGLSKWDTNQKAFFDTALTDSECIALTTL